MRLVGERVAAPSDRWALLYPHPASSDSARRKRPHLGRKSCKALKGTTLPNTQAAASLRRLRKRPEGGAPGGRPYRTGFGTATCFAHCRLTKPWRCVATASRYRFFRVSARPSMSGIYFA